MTKRAYQYRFYPTAEQTNNLACTFGCTRFVYNWALKCRKTAYFQEGKKLYHKDLSAALTALKKEEGTAWLKEVSSVPLQQALRHLDTAFTNFFEDRADYPVYKKKHGTQSATYTANAFTWDGASLTLAKQHEPLDIHWSRPLPDGTKPSSVTLTKDRCGRYFVSILVEEEIKPLPRTSKTVGIDLGLKAFLITSNGETIANPKLHARIADTRRDFQHQTSTRLIRENQVICLETLAVKNMLKNHKLAKAIADVGWSEFVRLLEHKAKWHGRTIIRIDRFYPSSKTCSACGHVLETLALDVREWGCSCCGAWHDRDINAAQNIMTAGLAACNACGGDVRPVQVRA